MNNKLTPETMNTTRKYSVKDNDTSISTNEGTIVMTFKMFTRRNQLTRKELKKVDKLKIRESITIGFFTITRI